MDAAHIEATYNPWANDDNAYGLRSAIYLAEQTGHIARKGDTLVKAKERLGEMVSMKMIQLQEAISVHNEQMNKVNFEIQRRMLYHEIKDLIEEAAVEKKAGQMKKLADHLQNVVSSKEILIRCLQQPFVGTYINLDSAFHRYAMEFFCMLAPLMSNLSAHLDNLHWINASTVYVNQLESLVTELSSVLASLQAQFQSIEHMSQCIQSLHHMEHSVPILDLY